MKCPTCGDRTPDAWKTYQAAEPAEGGGHRMTLDLPAGPTGPMRRNVSLDWMHCANESCAQLVIRMHEQFMAYEGTRPLGSTQESRIVRPRYVMPGWVAPEVPEDLRRDYGEAVAILHDSHRMSAVLSRRILADLLERYANLTDFGLKDRIDKFVADTTHPHELRANLGYLAEMGNFGAHTQTNDQAEIVDVDLEQAEWTLKIVQRLFDYFIITPERDKAMREAFDKKLEEASRKPIEPVPEEDAT